MTLVAILIRILVTVGFLWIVLRLQGKRDWQAARPHDLLIALVLGSLGQRIIAGGVELSSAFLALGLFAWLHLMLTVILRYSRSLRNSLLGKSAILVRDGRLQHATLAREMISNADLQEILHTHGIERPEEIKELRFDTYGRIALTLIPENKPLSQQDIVTAFPRPTEGIRWQRAA